MMYYCRDCVSITALVDDNMSVQQAALRDRSDILVATPARLVAHLKAGNVELKNTVSASFPPLPLSSATLPLRAVSDHHLFISQDFVRWMGFLRGAGLNHRTNLYTQATTDVSCTIICSIV